MLKLPNDWLSWLIGEGAKNMKLVELLLICSRSDGRTLRIAEAKFCNVIGTGSLDRRATGRRTLTTVASFSDVAAGGINLSGMRS